MAIRSKKFDNMSGARKRAIVVILFIACVVLLYLAMVLADQHPIWKRPL